MNIFIIPFFVSIFICWHAFYFYSVYESIVQVFTYLEVHESFSIDWEICLDRKLYII